MVNYLQLRENISINTNMRKKETKITKTILASALENSQVKNSLT